MSLLAGLQNTKVDVRAESVGFQFLPSDVYLSRLKMLFLDKTEKGTVYASGELEVVPDVTQPAKTVKKFFKEYISYAGGEFTKVNAAGVTTQMSGLGKLNKLLILTTGKTINEAVLESRTVEIMESGAKKMVERDVFIDALGQQVQTCMTHVVVDKQQKNAAGVYVNTGDTREDNEIEAFLDVATLKSVDELQGDKEAVYVKQFKEKYVTGKPYVKAKGVANGATAGAPQRPAGVPQAGGTPVGKATSLF